MALVLSSLLYCLYEQQFYDRRKTMAAGELTAFW